MSWEKGNNRNPTVYWDNRKIKGNIYLYRVESYWDKTKKQARQKRIYIGPKNKKQKKVNFNTANIIHKKFGNMFLLKDIAENLGLQTSSIVPEIGE